MEKIEILALIAKKLRIHALKMTSEAGSGHPTTCMSMAELAACLFFDEMQYNILDPFDWANDELVLSKGHAAPLLWAAYAEAGIISIKDLMNLRKLSSPLEGHPTPRMKWIKAATGSLGQGLSVGVGMAAAMKLAKSLRRVYVVMGDGECAEGSVWEAANTAIDLNLDNLCVLIDINRLAQSGATMHGFNLNAYKNKFEAFGWEVFKVNGHKVGEILQALGDARKSEKPSVILAKTIKGKGVSFLEDKNGWHGKPLKEQDLEEALNQLGPMPDLDAKKYVCKPEKVQIPLLSKEFNFKKNIYSKDTATRRAYGNALVNLGEVNNAVVSIDGDVKNSTYAESFFEAFPERSFQCYIAEQNMVGMGIGMAAKGFFPFMATFSAFLGRAHDQIRMAAYSNSNIKLAGSHAGVSIGADGPSQMGLEDLAIFTPIPGCAVLYPCDAYSGEACVESMVSYEGMAYIRTTRPATPMLYDRKEKFPIGGPKVLRENKKDTAAVIAVGITVFEALKAYEKLKAAGIFVCVIDAYSVKPLDKDNILNQINSSGEKVVVVEDHYPVGGLGSVVASVLGGNAELIHLAVKNLPRSGKPEELMDKYGISAPHIVEAVNKLLKISE